MNDSWSITLYRFLMRAYPAEFRTQYGEPIDQAFRDMHRDAFQKRGYPGLALLWLHVVPDFLFSVGEVLLRKAGDFLKWRFRLQWVIACTVAFALSRLANVAIGLEFFRGLEPWTRTLMSVVILAGSLGLMQSRVLAGRCFRKKQWALYGLVGAVLGTIVSAAIWRIVGVPLEAPRVITHALQDVMGAWEGVRLQALARTLFNFPVVIVGACAGLLQSAAIRNDAITRYRWMTACAVGYYLSTAAGQVFMEYNPTFVAGTMVSALVTGTVLGLATSGPLERILFAVEADGN